MGAKSSTPHSGFSLTEMLLAVGLIGIVMMGTMKMFRDAFRTQTKVEAGQDSILITEQLARLLSDAPTCTTLMKGTLSQSGSPVTLGTALYEGAQLGKIKITDLRLRDPEKLIENTFIAKVEMRGDKASGEGGNSFVRELPIVYRTDERDYLIECLGDNFGAKGNCLALSGKWDDKKRSCDLCSALGGESNSRGRCMLSGSQTGANCPMQKAFGANSTIGVCGGYWDSDFIADSVSYLSTFGHVKAETIAWYKEDLRNHLDNPPEGESPAKKLGGRGNVSWALTTEPPNELTGKPCASLVYFTVRCP